MVPFARFHAGAYCARHGASEFRVDVMSDDYYRALSKWWENQWEKYHYTVYAAIVSFFLIIFYYLVAYTEPDAKVEETTRKFLLGIIADAIPTLIIIIISFALFRKISEKKGEREKMELLSEIEDRMKKSVTSESDLRRMLYESGLQGIYDRHHRDTVLEEIRACSKEVRVLHTFLVEPNRFERAFVGASQNGAKIKVLLLEPNSDIARQRSIDIWPGDNPADADEGYVPSQIRMTVDEFRRIKQENNLENFEIRLYDTLLSVQIFRCDDDLYLGFYPHGRKALEAAQLKIHGHTYISVQFLNEFDLVWGKATPVELG